MITIETTRDRLLMLDYQIDRVNKCVHVLDQAMSGKATVTQHIVDMQAGVLEHSGLSAVEDWEWVIYATDGHIYKVGGGEVSTTYQPFVETLEDRN